MIYTQVRVLFLGLRLERSANINLRRGNCLECAIRRKHAPQTWAWTETGPWSCLSTGEGKRKIVRVVIIVGPEKSCTNVQMTRALGGCISALTPEAGILGMSIQNVRKYSMLCRGPVEVRSSIISLRCSAVESTTQWERLRNAPLPS